MKKLWSLLLTVIFAMGIVSPAFAAETYAQDIAMTVNGQEYLYHSNGWSDVMYWAAAGRKVNVVLHSDWKAEDGVFDYLRGTDKGRLSIDNSEMDITIDLNGYTIDRGLADAVDDGQVFNISGGKLTITDSVGTGEITGGNNIGNGGAFCVEGSGTLVLDGGTICWNEAKNGAGVYVSNASFYMNGGSIEENTAEYGGGISVGRDDAEYIVVKGGKIANNTARVGGGVCLDSETEDSVITFEDTEISGNTATDAGGGVYIGFLYEACKANFGEGVVITQNVANEGGGVYVSCGSIGLIGAHITENQAYTRCGGVGTQDDMDDNAHGNAWEYGKYTLGGDTYIQDNYVQANQASSAKIKSNLRIGDVTCDLSYDANNPFTDDASIGIDIYADFGIDAEKLSDSYGNFAVDSYEHFTSDRDDCVITVRDGGASAGANRYQIYFEHTGAAVRGGIIGATLKSNFKSETEPLIDSENKTVTLSVNPTMGRTLKNVALSTIADFVLGDDALSIVESEIVMDLTAKGDSRWEVKAKNNSYELWYIKIVPFGGEWSEEDGSVASVTVGGNTNYYADFETAWTTAVEASTQKKTLFTLNKNWCAGDADSNGVIDSNETAGKFKYYKNGSEYGTNSGRLYLNDITIDLTIDLNGNTIDRALTSTTSDGQVFYMDVYGSLTIKDSSEDQTGKITGANNDGNGGAFYVDYGTLYVKGGNIAGNQAKYGAGIYCDDLDDAIVYIQGGKISGNTATSNGGGLYLENGYLYVEDGEISGNRAKDGAGVYWASRNAGCFTGGKISGNIANESGGGIYGSDWGDMYFGGTMVISGNTVSNGSPNNVYLSENDVDINRTAAQADGVPSVPFKDGASIGISMAETDGTDLISGKNSLFDSNNFGYFFGDNTSYFVRAVFDEDGGNNTHKLYYNKWSYKDAVYPKIATVAVRENNGLISEASIDVDKQIITLKAISPDKTLFKSVVVESLVSFTTSNDADVYWRFCDMAFDLTKPFEYKVVSKSTGTYVHCKVVVEFPECDHDEEHEDGLCGGCNEYLSNENAVAKYEGEDGLAIICVTEAGKYSVVFADYENGRLENVDIVEYDFDKGTNYVSQEDTSFILSSGDKVMLLKDMGDLVPVCGELTLN